ncbi:hypothetical protein TNCV_946971 [Trichonephila clavipes]|nr:hypothetical protein TNCV_946971 [Trichonephila clavipes]
MPSAENAISAIKLFAFPAKIHIEPMLPYIVEEWISKNIPTKYCQSIRKNDYSMSIIKLNSLRTLLNSKEPPPEKPEFEVAPRRKEIHPSRSTGLPFLMCPPQITFDASLRAPSRITHLHVRAVETNQSKFPVQLCIPKRRFSGINYLPSESSNAFLVRFPSISLNAELLASQMRNLSDLGRYVKSKNVQDGQNKRNR